MPEQRDLGRRGPVVVGVDGSRDGLRAVRYAAQRVLAGSPATQDTEIWLVHVRGTGPLGPDRADLVLAEARSVAISAGLDDSRLRGVVVDGVPAAALIEQLASSCAVVLGIRGHSELRLPTRATSSAVAAHASAATYCVPPTWDDTLHRSRVVVGLVQSEHGAATLAAGFAEAERTGSELHVIHARDPGPVPYFADPASQTDEQALARAALTEMVEIAARTATSVSWTLLLENTRPTVALHRAALEADQLVLGRRGRPGPLSSGIGSTTLTLLRSAAVPVVVVATEAH